MNRPNPIEQAIEILKRLEADKIAIQAQDVRKGDKVSYGLTPATVTAAKTVQYNTWLDLKTLEGFSIRMSMKKNTIVYIYKKEKTDD